MFPDRFVLPLMVLKLPLMSLLCVAWLIFSDSTLVSFVTGVVVDTWF